MKKILMMVAFALCIGTFVSCNKTAETAEGTYDSENNTEKRAYNPENDAQLDTLTQLYGEMVGYGMASRYEGDSTFNKTEFMKGLQAAMKIGENEASYLEGLMFGVQFKGSLVQMKEAQKIQINERDWYVAFKKAFTDDTIKNPYEIQPKLQELMRTVSEKVKANDPKAILNKKLQQKYITDSLANNPEVKKSSKGVYYKMIAVGDANDTTRFTLNDRVMVKYTGRHLSGEVFDSSKDEAVEMSPRGVIEGFKEMILMMKPGAKVIAYIPYELGYRVEGSAPVIEPCEMLIFEIETVGLKNADEKKKK